jgi:HEAT repeat protein
MEARGYSPDPAGLSKALLEGKEVAVRAEAAFLLGYLQAGSSAESRQLFADAPLRAARALALLGDPGGYARVVEALESEFPSNRMEAIAVLPAFLPYAGQTAAGQPIEVIGRLTAATQDPEPDVREFARQLVNRA